MVVVSSPKLMPDWGDSYDNHTLSIRDGYLTIFHSFMYSSQWTYRCTLYNVIMKGHIRTGQPMYYFLKSGIKQDQS